MTNNSGSIGENGMVSESIFFVPNFGISEIRTRCERCDWLSVSATLSKQIERQSQRSQGVRISEIPKFEPKK